MEPRSSWAGEAPNKHSALSLLGNAVVCVPHRGAGWMQLVKIKALEGWLLTAGSKGKLRRLQYPERR